MQLQDYAPVMGEARVLADVIHHWGEAYEIWYANGAYHARRRDTGATVHALDAEALMNEIQADYVVKPVPRTVAPGTLPQVGRP